MSAILKNFQIVLTKKQASEIRDQFQAACKESKIPKAAMLAQPKTQFGGMGSVALIPPILDVAVISSELFEAVSAVIKSHRPTQ